MDVKLQAQSRCREASLTRTIINQAIHRKSVDVVELDDGRAEFSTIRHLEFANIGRPNRQKCASIAT